MRVAWRALPVTRAGGRAVLDRAAPAEPTPVVPARALDPCPVAVRTPDARHLATAELGRAHGQAVEPAGHADGPLAAARARRLPTYRS